MEKQTKTFRPLEHICYYAQQMMDDSRYTESVQRMVRECPLDIKTIPEQHLLKRLCDTLIRQYMANNNGSMDIFKANYKGNGYRISAAELDKPTKNDGKKDCGKPQRQNPK